MVERHRNESNRGAFMTAPASNHHEVRDGVFPTPQPDQLVIRVHAAAINPADHVIATRGIIIDHALYPVVGGCDFAGEVASIGNEANKVYDGKGHQFKVGDRVLGCCDQPGVKGQGAYQLYTVADARLCAILPDNIPYADGCVLPLGFGTAAAGLSHKDGLGMPCPGSENQNAWKDKWVLVWGAASSVGSCAVQLCKAVGLKVAVTASSRNEESCMRTLGADLFFDYKKDGVNDDIVAALTPFAADFMGIFAAVGNIGPAGDQLMTDCGVIVKEIGGRKVVGTIRPPLPQFAMPKTVPDDVHYCFSKNPRSLSSYAGSTY